MATSTPATLSIAAKYQSLFTNSSGIYSGAEKLIPLNLTDGRTIWITGLRWTGSLTSGGVARSTTSIHNIFSGILVQGRVTLQALQPAIYDSTNTRYFSLSSLSINNVPYARLDPVTAITHANSIVVSCRYSPTDFTSWTLALGQIYATFIRFNSSIGKNVVSVTASYALPVVTVSGNTVYFGSSLLDLNDGYLYMGGQAAVAGNYNHYLARIPWPFIYDLTHVEYYGSSGWTRNALNLVPMLTNVGQEISMWKASGKFYILAKMGATNNTINLYSSSLIGQGYTATLAGTAVSPPSGGWSNGAYYVPGTSLASGKRLAFYTNGISNDTYDKANPQYKSPTFLEF